MAEVDCRSAPYPINASAAPKNDAPAPKKTAPPSSVWRQLSQFHERDVNLGPTLALSVPIFLVFCSLAAFIEVYILVGNASSFLAIFFVGSYIVFSSYFVANHYMEKFSSSYAAIADDKKFYVLSNLIKSAALLAYTPSAAVTLYNACIVDDWSTPRIRAMGVLYAIPDAVSLLLVTRMATSTKVHHLCVVFFMVVNLVVTYEHETVGRALVVYGTFSTFAYLVNLLLASRFLNLSAVASLTLSTLALLIYAGCLGANWLWQIAYLYKLCWLATPSPLHGCCIALFLALISQVVRDDVVLVAWLYKNANKRAHEMLAEGAAPSPKRKKAQ